MGQKQVIEVWILDESSELLPHELIRTLSSLASLPDKPKKISLICSYNCDSILHIVEKYKINVIVIDTISVEKNSVYEMISDIPDAVKASYVPGYDYKEDDQIAIISCGDIYIKFKALLPGEDFRCSLMNKFANGNISKSKQKHHNKDEVLFPTISGTIIRREFFHLIIASYNDKLDPKEYLQRILSSFPSSITCIVN